MKNNTRIFIPAVLLMGFAATALFAVEPQGSKLGPPRGQSAFVSPDEAVKALQSAAEARDRAALRKLFGPEYDTLGTGDRVQDEKNLAKFSEAMAEGCNPVKETDQKIVIDVGTNNWPLPIPLVKEGELWHFDTVAGREEILNRHIGRDELHAIGVCRAYVKAQQEYAAGVGRGAYVRKFRSSPGQKDGLYWKASDGESPSPLGDLVAEAHAEGYSHHNGAGPHPYYGYYFHILTRQGRSAPGGKMNYARNGELRDGFALVAYPEKWDQSGVMTFIVNQDGKIYQRDLGEKTGRVASALKDYDPNNQWTLVEDDGVMDPDLQK